MTFEEFASSVVEAWSRPRKHMPIMTLSEGADRAYWQASNMCGFTGTRDEWIAFCLAKLPADHPLRPYVGTPPSKPAPAPLDDIEDWLNR